MKILKRNENFGVFPMTITCKRVVDIYGFAYGEKNDFCGSELEIESSDIKKHEWSKYPDYSGVDYGVVCPVCNQFVVVDEKVIPKLVKESADKILLSDIGRR